MVSKAAADSGVGWRVASTTDQRVFGNRRGASLDGGSLLMGTSYPEQLSETRALLQWKMICAPNPNSKVGVRCAVQSRLAMEIARVRQHGEGGLRAVPVTISLEFHVVRVGHPTVYCRWTGNQTFMFYGPCRMPAVNAPPTTASTKCARWVEWMGVTFFSPNLSCFFDGGGLSEMELFLRRHAALSKWKIFFGINPVSRFIHKRCCNQYQDLFFRVCYFGFTQNQRLIIPHVCLSGYLSRTGYQRAQTDGITIRQQIWSDI